MALTFPLDFPSVGIANINMRLKRAVAVSESIFSYDQQVHQFTGARWECEITLPPLSHSEARAVEAFITGLEGRKGTFRFGHPLHTSTVTARNDGVIPVRSDSFTTNGSASAITAGTYFQVGDYLHIVTADKAYGAQTLHFQPPLRAELADATDLDFTLPKSLWRLATNETTWSTDTASIYGFTLACVEAI